MSDLDELKDLTFLVTLSIPADEEVGESDLASAIWRAQNPSIPVYSESAIIVERQPAV